jgi:hypothetical protein
MKSGLTLNLAQGLLQKLLPESWLFKLGSNVCLNRLNKSSLLSFSLLLFVSNP